MSLTGVIQSALHPPLELCVLEAIAGGPYGSGIHAFQRVRGAVNVDAFGITWSTVTLPAGYGLNVGASSNYADRVILQIGEFGRLLDGSLHVIDQADYTRVQGIHLFHMFSPQVIDVQIAPYVTMNFSWVLFL